MGLVSGFTGITCCVSPWYWRCWGLPTTAEAVSLGDTPVLHIRLVFPRGRHDSSHYRRGPLSSTARCMLNRRCIRVSLDVVRPEVLSNFDLRWPLLVHKVPWHLVRLALQDTALWGKVKVTPRLAFPWDRQGMLARIAFQAPEIDYDATAGQRHPGSGCVRLYGRR